MTQLEIFLEHKTNIYFGKDLNAKYLTKFDSSNLHLFYINKKYYALTDNRYLEAASTEIKNMIVLDISKKESFELLIKEIKNSQELTLYIDKERTTLKEFTNLKNMFKDIELKPIETFDEIRLCKTQEEIRNLKKAVQITDEIFDKLLKFIKPGLSELEIKTYIRSLIVNSEADLESFSPIVAGGQNSSKPHWRGSDYILQEGDFLTLDFGQFYKNITSDMTRTLFIGSNPSEEQIKVYNLVLQANIKAIAAIKPGIKASDIDKIARDYLTENGYGANFIHTLGHGLGMDIHELPSVSSQNDIILKEGMIITIEPGIYIENKFGVRIEDDILITKTGYEILNKSSKELIKLK